MPFGALVFGLGYMYLRYRKLKGSEPPGGEPATVGAFLRWLFSRGPSSVPEKSKTTDSSNPAHVHTTAIGTATAFGVGASQGSDFGSSSADTSSASSDSGSSSGNDSAGSYSGGSDFGGGGTDTSW
jgi:hypothetical protein